VCSVAARTLPRHGRHALERLYGDVPVRPPLARAAHDPLAHEMRHERRRNDRIVAATVSGSADEVFVEELAPLPHDDRASRGRDISAARRNRDETIRVAVDDHDPFRLEGPGAHRAIELADVITPITAAADDHDRSVPVRIEPLIV
jgi:hypothetical protein